MQTSVCSSQGGKSYSGYCVGPSDLQCCVKGTPTTSTYGVDVSAQISSSSASCLQSAGIRYNLLSIIYIYIYSKQYFEYSLI